MKLLIIYDHFYPGYRAGGPVQSLVNLAIALHSRFEVFVITRDRDLTESKTYPRIIINQWNKVKLQEENKYVFVFYSDSTLDKKSYRKVINDINPLFIYFNNIYSYHFFLLPLFALKVTENPAIVICPRGMLQQGALAVKPFKKKIYLAFLHFTGFLNKAFWHATNKEEENDIKKYFPVNKGTVVAPNIPKPPLNHISYPVKQQGYLHLIFLSLIAEKKNILLLLQIIKASKKNIVLHIYGPVTDKKYWLQCLQLIQQMPDKVQYKGEVQPAVVQEVISKYHALILLTKGENFGHALYESLSAGRPVITSFFTPWRDLKQKNAGVNADINSSRDCLEKLNKFAEMNQKEYNTYCEGAHLLALQYYQNLNAEVKYRELFG